MSLWSLEGVVVEHGAEYSAWRLARRASARPALGQQPNAAGREVLREYLGGAGVAHGSGSANPASLGRRQRVGTWERGVGLWGPRSAGDVSRGMAGRAAERVNSSSAAGRWIFRPATRSDPGSTLVNSPRMRSLFRPRRPASSWDDDFRSARVSPQVGLTVLTTDVRSGGPTAP